MANGVKVSQLVYDMALPIAKANGLDVYDVEYKKEGSGYVLRVILDTNDDSGEYVSVDACEAVSRSLSELLDKNDPTDGAYMLEVTSPGLDRPLKKNSDFVRFSGRVVDVGLYKALNGIKTLSGTLVSKHDGVITLTSGDKEINIPQGDVSYIRLAVIF